jgi:hypothetical protein
MAKLPNLNQHQMEDGASAEPNFTRITVPVHRLSPEGWEQTTSIARNHRSNQAARLRGAFFL